MFIAFLIIGLICIFFYVPAVFSTSIAKMQYDNLSLKEILLTKIPVVNVIFAEFLYTGKAIFSISSDILFIITFTLRYFVKDLAPGTSISTLTIILFLVSVIAVWAANSYLVFIIIHDADIKSLTFCILSAVFFTIGQHYISTYMVTEIKNLEKNKETFG